MTATPSLFARFILIAGMAVALLSGCASGGPEVGAAEADLEEDNYEASLSSLEDALDRDSSNASAYEMKATVLRRMADSSMAPDEYIELYRRAQAAEDSAITYRSRREDEIQERRFEVYQREVERGESAYNRANKYERESLYRRSISFFGAAGILQPDSARPVLNEAYARLRVGQRAEVIPVLEEYVDRVDTTNQEAAKILGELYVSTGAFERATELLDRATLYYPDDQELHALRLDAYNRAGNMEEALLAYREQIERKPERARYRLHYGTLLLEAARYNDAIRELRKAVELRPEHAESQYNLGAAYYNAALAREDSITTLQEEMEAGGGAAEEASADSVLTLSQRVDSLRQRRQRFFRKAVPPLERARRLSPAGTSRQDACRALFVAYMQTQRPNKASRVEGCTGFTSAGRE